MDYLQPPATEAVLSIPAMHGAGAAEAGMKPLDPHNPLEETAGEYTSKWRCLEKRKFKYEVQ